MASVPQSTAAGKPKAPTHPEDIKAAVRKRGVNLTQLALAAGLYESACRIAIRGYGSPDGEKAIAQFLGYSPKDLFPERYDVDGRRIDPRLRMHRSVRANVGHGLIDGAGQ